ncbi:hypothetical protein WMY93_021792 [Mugilogobius chulae]|uniref:26S proteasome non-ATPase regulatory subunit 5 n=1 Tax=Mugilogobius chulae TaxID=88201 RepID=A0AAW0NBP8_9GOBI
MAASIESLLNEISSVDDLVEKLQSLKTVLHSVPVNTLRDAVSGQRLGIIFSLLNSNSREQVELCVDILERILLALSPVFLAQNYKAELQGGVKHNNEAVKILALTQIGRIVEHPEAVNEILNNNDLLCAVIYAIGEEKMSVAKQAIKCLSKLSHSKASLDKLFQPDLLKPIKEVMAVSDVVRYRVYELVVEISSFSPISFGYCVNSGLVSQLLSELTGDDVLIRRKFKAVLVRMSHHASTGATELRVRSLEAIAQLLTLQPEQQTDDLLALTESWFQLLSKHPMDMIQQISTQPFPELHCSALCIFTAIASQPWGQRLMISTPGFMEFVLDRSTSPSKDAKDAKFELIGALVSSSSAAEILGSQNCLRLKTYLREGPYYVTAVAAVGTEGAN